MTEQATISAFKLSGLFDRVDSIQTESRNELGRGQQGIDIIALGKNNVIYSFEVKGSSTRNKVSLTADQRKGFKFFTSSRLDSFTKTGGFHNKRASADTIKTANFYKNRIDTGKSRLDGRVIDIRNLKSGSPNTRFRAF